MNPLGRVLQFFRPDLHRVALVLFFLVTAAGASLLRPWPVAFVVDSVLGTEPLPVWLRSFLDPRDQRQVLAVLAASVLGLHLAQGGLWTALNYVSMQIGLGGMRRAREEMFACLQRLSVRFVQAARSGDLVHRTAADTYSLHVLWQHGLVMSASAVLMLVLMMGVLWRIDATLALVVLMVVPLLFVASKYFEARVGDRAAAAQQADHQITAFVQHSIAVLPLTQSCGREDLESAGFQSRTAAAAEKRRVQTGWDLGYWLVIATVLGLGMAGLVWLGGRQVLSGQLTLGELLVFLAYLPLFYEPVRHLSGVGTVLAEAAAGTNRVFALLDTPEQVRESPRARPVLDAGGRGDRAAETGGLPAAGDRAVRVRGNVEFDHVVYGDQREADLLQDVSFRVEAGQSVAILGPHAVAKSTVLNLLARFFDPVSGTIRLEGVDLRELRLKELRARIALVSPDPILLPASIAENIAYGKTRARRGEIEAAARAARAEAFIQGLPNGYQTLVGEGGMRLAPGERQRLSMARAFLRDAPILLVEEPAGAPDPDTEEDMAASLRELRKGRTALIVAHRSTTLLNVDRVLVLRDGRVVEDGTPLELRQGGGYFARLAKGELALD